MEISEQANPLTTRIDQLSTLEALTIINAEDQKVARAVERALPSIAKAVDAIVVRIRLGGRLFYIGTGTSGRLGVLDASECPPTFGVSPELVQGVIAGGYEACYQAVEASEDDRDAGAEDLKARGVDQRDAVIGIAASGRTAYTIGALAYARRLGAFTACITCNQNTELAASVELPIEPIVGPEVIAGSTRLKSGTAQKLILNMLSTMTMVRLGYVQGNRMSNVQTKNRKLRERAVGILAAESGLDAEAARLALEAADWKLPVALVMQQGKVSRAQAEAVLAKHGGSVAPAISALVS